jgi:hypothetical protein
VEGDRGLKRGHRTLEGTDGCIGVGLLRGWAVEGLGRRGTEDWRGGRGP